MSHEQIISDLLERYTTRSQLEQLYSEAVRNEQAAPKCWLCPTGACSCGRGLFRDVARVVKAELGFVPNTPRNYGYNYAILL